MTAFVINHERTKTKKAGLVFMPLQHLEVSLANKNAKEHDPCYVGTHATGPEINGKNGKKHEGNIG